jgi:hypothetical protein
MEHQLSLFQKPSGAEQFKLARLRAACAEAMSEYERAAAVVVALLVKDLVPTKLALARKEQAIKRLEETRDALRAASYCALTPITEPRQWPLAG